MSHFSVLVITDTAEQINDALAPFHEFECTGLDDVYVQDIDKTDEYRKEFEEGTESRLKDPDGNFHYPYDDAFYRELTTEEETAIHPAGGSGVCRVNGAAFSYMSKDWGDGRGYRPKTRFVPEGWEEVEVSRSEIMTFAEWLTSEYDDKSLQIGEPIDLQGKHKYGYVVLHPDGNVERAVRRSNPDKHWDWWQIGGRFSGRMRVKPGAMGAKGNAGLMGSQYSAEGVDICLAGDLDLDGMLEEERNRRAAAWDAAEAKYNAKNTTTQSLEEALARYGELIGGFLAGMKDPESPVQGPLYKLIENNPEAYELRTRIGMLEWEHGIGPYSKNRQHHIDRAQAFSTFAVIKDNKWYEKGEMGWWGVVSDEKDEDEWLAQFNALLRDLPPTKVLSVIDCHI